MYQERRSVAWSSVAFVVTVMALVALLVAPASAFAKTTTRILIRDYTTRKTMTSKSYVVDWKLGPTSAAAPKVIATVQRRTSSGSWVTVTSGLSRSSITIWRLDSSGNETTVPGTPKSKVSGVAIPLEYRGKYRVQFSGNSTYKSSTGYVTRKDALGDRISNLNADVTSRDATWTYVTLSYDLSWNSAAFTVDDQPFYVRCETTFEKYDADLRKDVYSGYVVTEQDTWDQGTTQIWFRVRNKDIADGAELHVGAKCYSADDYIVTSSTSSLAKPVTF